VVEIALGGPAEQEVPLGGGVCERAGRAERVERDFKDLNVFKGFKGSKALKKTLDIGR